MTDLDESGQICDNGGAEFTPRQQARQSEGDIVRDALERNLSEAFRLPPAPVEWLLGLWDAIQFLDDVADGDDIPRSEIDRAIYALLVGMPANRFFMEYAATLLPCVSVMILKWQASDHAERNGQADAKSYMWRAGYYDLVLLVFQICHGQEAAVKDAPAIMGLYGETFEEYKKEFPNA